MQIDHIAFWVKDIERMKLFYMQYFNCASNEKYYNNSKKFESYFLTFENGACLELMKMPGVPDNRNDPSEQYTGIIHIAIKVGNRDKVDKLTGTLRKDGYTVISEPRDTGDGYYESCILDPENNRIEITA